MHGPHRYANAVLCSWSARLLLLRSQASCTLSHFGPCGVHMCMPRDASSCACKLWDLV